MGKDQYAVDLHIHSLLSPCANEDMIANNIVNMCKLKQLDIISITDHNSTANLPIFDKLCKEQGILLLPGIEVNTKEEVHLLCYFKYLNDAMEFGDVIYKHLPNIKNNEKIFGTQYVLDEWDQITSSIFKLLISATDLSVEEVVQLARSHGGQVVPAHVDKASYSILNHLGFIPEELNLKTLECIKAGNKNFISNITGEKRYNMIQSSDAHYLHQILERVEFIQLSELTTIELLNYL